MKTIKTAYNSQRVYLRLFITANLLLFPLFSFSQVELSCANEIFQTKQLQDTNFINHLKALQNASNAVNQRINGTILEVPIVVHVLHLGEPVGTGTNISDQQIIDAVQGANERFRKINTTDGVDMEVEFCMAQFDPNGNPSNGIVRIDASTVPLYREIGIGYIEAFLDGIYGADEIAVKNLSNWRHNYVYNIWVVNKIAGGWGGYAFFPLPNGEFSTDGTVITSGAIRYTSSTLAHELGHGMGLLHTFQGSENGCPPNNICFLQGDFICDTPPHKKSDCANSACNSSADSMYSLKNTMSYCSGRGLFTQGQKDRVRTTIFNSSRNQLMRSTACTGITTNTENQKANAKLSIFPNPSNGVFTLITEIKANETAIVEIWNSLGQIIAQQKLATNNSHIISLPAEIAKGVYQLLLKKNGEVAGVSLIQVK